MAKEGQSTRGHKFVPSFVTLDWPLALHECGADLYPRVLSERAANNVSVFLIASPISIPGEISAWSGADCLAIQRLIPNIRADFLRFTSKSVEHSCYLPVRQGTW